MFLIIGEKSTFFQILDESFLLINGKVIKTLLTQLSNLPEWFSIDNLRIFLPYSYNQIDYSSFLLKLPLFFAILYNIQSLGARDRAGIGLSYRPPRQAHRLAESIPGFLKSGVADPDPPDPHVFGPSGSGSTSQRYGSGSGSFDHHAKIVRKTLIPTIFWLFLTFYLWKMM